MSACGPSPSGPACPPPPSTSTSRTATRWSKLPSSHCWEDFRRALKGAFEVDDPFERLRVGGAIYAGFALSYPRRYAVMITETDNLPGATEIGLAAFNDLVTMVADILDANGDDRDAVYVATLVHTWTHGIVSLMPCTKEIPWPSLDELLNEVLLRLGLVPKGT